MDILTLAVEATMKLIKDRDALGPPRPDPIRADVILILSAALAGDREFLQNRIRMGKVGAA